MKFLLNEEASRVDFIAYAPMHKFKGWATKKLTGSLEIDFDNLNLANIQAMVETSCLDTGDDSKNKAMVEYFSLDKHPQASFIMTECKEFSKEKDNLYKITVLGILGFAGIRRQLPITCTLNHTDKQLSLDLQFKWSFKAYGIAPPTLLFLKVRDIVDIKARLFFTAADNG
jgi:polyisoprenoid-binding protein YceI